VLAAGALGCASHKPTSSELAANQPVTGGAETHTDSVYAASPQIDTSKGTRETTLAADDFSQPAGATGAVATAPNGGEEPARNSQTTAAKTDEPGLADTVDDPGLAKLATTAPPAQPAATEPASNAEQQGKSAKDREITQRIRESLVTQNDLSFTAKNVKVITSDGRVTLRGPVRNSHEKVAIENVARNVAGTDHVANQLQVTAK